MFRASNGIRTEIITAEGALRIYRAHEKSRVGSPSEGFTVWPVGATGQIIDCAWTRIEPLGDIPPGLLEEAEV